MSKKKVSYAFTWLLIVTVFNCSMFFPLLAEAETRNITEQNTVIAETMPIWNNNPFSDVRDSDWFIEDVEYVTEKQLMKGTSDKQFSPYDKTTRAMIATVLWRLEESPDTLDKQEFSDVQKDTYYYDAVMWAADNKIATGYNDESFGPNDFVTREQLATMLYRYAAFKDYDMTKKSALDGYEDKKEISDYAVMSFQWAHTNKMISGTSENTLSPKEYASRCEVAAVLKRFCTQFYMRDETAKSQIETLSPMYTESDKNNAVNKPGIQVNGGYYESENENSGSPCITISNATGAPGEKVKLFVKIENNPGILGMILTAYYDDINLRLENVKNGEAVYNVLELTASKSLTSGVRFLWDGIDISSNDIEDGDVLSMEFSIPTDAQSGKYPVVFAFFDGDIVDRDFKSISPEIKNGYITVIKN